MGQRAVYNKELEDLLVLEEAEQKFSQVDETNTQPHTQTPVSLYPEFLEFVGRELTSFVGPIASVLMKNTLEQSPQIEPKEFTEALAKEIFDAQKAQEFRNRLQLAVEPKSAKLANPNSLHQPLGNYPAISDPEFLDRCRRELISFVGPFASVILIKDALKQHPKLTPTQLIETLMAEIPDEQKAQKQQYTLHNDKNLPPNFCLSPYSSTRFERQNLRRNGRRARRIAPAREYRQ